MKNHTLYLNQLRRLPFVKGLKIQKAPAETEDERLTLHTKDGENVVYILEEKNTARLNYALADRVARNIGRDPEHPGLLFAPHVTTQIGAFLAGKNVNYIDAVGNCHVTAGDNYFAHVEGKKPVRMERTTIREVGYRILFALLVQPDLVGAPIRLVAQKAGVAKTGVGSLFKRLETEGFITRTTRGRKLNRKGILMERWLVGYADTLRPRLLIGHFKTRDKDPATIERTIEAELENITPRVWGGGAAAFRMNGHYRGEQTVLHIEEAPHDIRQRLHVLAAQEGELTLLRAPGPMAYEGTIPGTAHPLLVYAELVTMGDERAREAAEILREKYLQDTE